MRWKLKVRSPSCWSKHLYMVIGQQDILGGDRKQKKLLSLVVKIQLCKCM